jgi:hypothetical protein
LGEANVDFGLQLLQGQAQQFDGVAHCFESVLAVAAAARGVVEVDVGGNVLLDKTALPPPAAFGFSPVGDRGVVPYAADEEAFELGVGPAALLANDRDKSALTAIHVR